MYRNRENTENTCNKGDENPQITACSSTANADNAYLTHAGQIVTQTGQIPLIEQTLVQYYSGHAYSQFWQNTTENPSLDAAHLNPTNFYIPENFLPYDNIPFYTDFISTTYVQTPQMPLIPDNLRNITEVRSTLMPEPVPETDPGLADVPTELQPLQLEALENLQISSITQLDSQLAKLSFTDQLNFLKHISGPNKRDTLALLVLEISNRIKSCKKNMSYPLKNIISLKELIVVLRYFKSIAEAGRGIQFNHVSFRTTLNALGITYEEFKEFNAGTINKLNSLYENYQGETKRNYINLPINTIAQTLSLSDFNIKDNFYTLMYLFATSKSPTEIALKLTLPIQQFEPKVVEFTRELQREYQDYFIDGYQKYDFKKLHQICKHICMDTKNLTLLIENQKLRTEINQSSGSFPNTFPEQVIYIQTMNKIEIEKVCTGILNQFNLCKDTLPEENKLQIFRSFTLYDLLILTRKYNNLLELSDDLAISQQNLVGEFYAMHFMPEEFFSLNNETFIRKIEKNINIRNKYDSTDTQYLPYLNFFLDDYQNKNFRLQDNIRAVYDAIIESPSVNYVLAKLGIRYHNLAKDHYKQFLNLLQTEFSITIPDAQLQHTFETVKEICLNIQALQHPQIEYPIEPALTEPGNMYQSFSQSISSSSYVLFNSNTTASSKRELAVSTENSNKKLKQNVGGQDEDISFLQQLENLDEESLQDFLNLIA